MKSKNKDATYVFTNVDMFADAKRLMRVARTGVTHLSAYSLTVESGTPLAAQVKRGLVPRPDDDLQATMLDALARFDLAWERIAASG